MKFGLFLLYGIIMLVLVASESFFLNGGSLFEKDKDGYLKLCIKGGVDATGWMRTIVLTLSTALVASMVPSAAWCGLIGFMAMEAALAYVVYWSVQEASSVKEVATFVLILVVLYIVARMGSIAMGGIIRHYAWLSVVMTLPSVSLSICITVVISTVCKYHGDQNPRGLDKDKCRICSIMALVVAVTGAVVAIYLLISGVQWRGF